MLILIPSCRVCEIENTNYNNIFDEENLGIIDKFRACTNILLEKDDFLPQFICEHCENDLNVAFNFRKKCEETDAKLRRELLLFKDSINEKNSEEDETLIETEDGEVIVVEIKIEEDIQSEDNIQIAHENIDVLKIEDENNDAITPEEVKDTDDELRTELLLKDTIHEEICVEDETLIETNVIGGKLIEKEIKIEDTLTPEEIECFEKNKRETSKRGFSCPECGKIYISQYTLKEHLQLHKDQQYKCTECEKTFATKGYLQRHYNIHLGLKPYKCDICEMSFLQTNNLTKHKLTHEKEQAYQCIECNKTFTTKANLTIHLKSHFGTTNNCQLCEKTFPDQGKLRRHNADFHEKLKPYKCSVCDRNFVQLHALQLHCSAIHSDLTIWKVDESQKTVLFHYIPKDKEKVQKYDCAECGKKFQNQSHLMKHFTSHRREKPYKCTQCGKTFAKSIYLKKHDMIHKGLKPFKCQVCQMSFRQSNNLAKHMLIHKGIKPYKCQVCQRSFRQSNNLTKHMLTHTRVKTTSSIYETCKCERPECQIFRKKQDHSIKTYNCTECGKTFATKYYLQKHGLIHQGLKPYQCEDCEMSFSQTNNLKRHMLNIHQKVYVGIRAKKKLVTV